MIFSYKNLLNKNKETAFSLTVFLMTWETAVRFGFINRLFISKPSSILLSAIDIFKDANIYSYLWTSGKILFIGLASAIFFGYFFGILFGSDKKIFNYFRIFIYSINAIPTVALMPLLILWFGIGLLPKVIIVFLFSFPPILINTIEGVLNTNKKFVLLINSLNGNDKNIITKVYIFSSLPYFFSGMKIAIGRSVIGIVVADLFGMGGGLGYLISYYGSMFQTSRLMVILFILLCLTLTLTMLVSILEKIIINWE